MKKAEPYRLLGIDPGTNVLGYAVIEVNHKKLTLIEMGVVKMGHLDRHQLKLKRIFERVQLIIRQHRPKEMAVEAPFFGKNVQSMLKLGRAQGVAIAAAMTKGVEIFEYAPKRIKQSVTGSGNASKEQVAAMLEQLLKTKMESNYLDASDALAAAVCHFFQNGRGQVGGKKYSGWSGFIKENPDRLKKK
ncbi:MAG: crossover junction endodeoxyribonuclease RuvC [Bacteroidota bacterium]